MSDKFPGTSPVETDRLVQNPGYAGFVKLFDSCRTRGTIDQPGDAVHRIDDMVDTAGTLCQAAGALKEHGAAGVFA